MTGLQASLSEPALASREVKSQTERRARDSLWHTLRDATRQEHRFLDDRLATLDFAHHRDYARFLKIHESALLSLAPRWRALDDADFAGLIWHLRDDLQALECAREDYADLSGRSRAQSLRQWGVSYVIRGSRLGGAVLRERIPGGFPTSYLDCQLQVAWPAFLEQLGHQSQSLKPAAHSHVVRGAKQAFTAFAAAATEFLP